MIKADLNNPDASDPRFISKQVTKLIKNKIQPLTYKHHVLKLENVRSMRASCNEIGSNRTEKVQLPAIAKKRKTEHKQNTETPPSPFKTNKKESKQRRKALVKLSDSLDPENYNQLQSKVEHHIMLKKILLMEDEYAQAQQCNKEEKAKKWKKIWTSPLQKYIGMFEMIEKPSEKVKLIDQTSCEKILQQIKSLKTMKHISCMEQNMPDMWNSNAKTLKTKRQPTILLGMKNLPNSPLKANERKLRQQIMSDIKKQYQIQGSSKIRININHQKMIKLI